MIHFLRSEQSKKNEQEKQTPLATSVLGNERKLDERTEQAGVKIQGEYVYLFLGLIASTQSGFKGFKYKKYIYE